MTLTRRAFVTQTAAVTAGFSSLRSVLARGPFMDQFAVAPSGFGPLVRDPRGVFDLPAGFSYRVLSRAGEEMHDGLVVPGKHDAMAALPGPDGLTLIVRNHEMERSWRPGPFGTGNSRLGLVDRAKLFDAGPDGSSPSLGGTTTLVYDTRAGKLIRHFMSLAGTERNCAGGPTPRGSWISCEETVVRAGGPLARDHGWCFEVPATAMPALADPRPITAMGRMNHEACATDPATGIVYLTEDRPDGSFYRYLPNDPDKLIEGGRLQALVLTDRRGADTRNYSKAWTMPVGEAMGVSWVDVEEVESPRDTLRAQAYADGAARFARGEGIWMGQDAAYFACTNGGPQHLGQIFRYRPSKHEGTPGEAEVPGTLELFLESSSPSIIENADNVTVAPFGDVIVCEDHVSMTSVGAARLIGITPDAQTYELGRNRLNLSELAGASFSPDGSTLFVNIQTPGLTLAITGPWSGDRPGP